MQIELQMMLNKILSHIRRLFFPTLKEQRRKEGVSSDFHVWTLWGRMCNSYQQPSKKRPFAVLTFSGNPLTEDLTGVDGRTRLLFQGVSYKNLSGAGWGEWNGKYYELHISYLDGSHGVEYKAELDKTYVHYPIPYAGISEELETYRKRHAQGKEANN